MRLELSNNYRLRLVFELYKLEPKGISFVKKTSYHRTHVCLQATKREQVDCREGFLYLGVCFRSEKCLV